MEQLLAWKSKPIIITGLEHRTTDPCGVPEGRGDLKDAPLCPGSGSIYVKLWKHVRVREKLKLIHVTSINSCPLILHTYIYIYVYVYGSISRHFHSASMDSCLPFSLLRTRQRPRSFKFLCPPLQKRPLMHAQRATELLFHMLHTYM